MDKVKIKVFDKEHDVKLTLDIVIDYENTFNSSFFSEDNNEFNRKWFIVRKCIVRSGVKEAELKARFANADSLDDALDIGNAFNLIIENFMPNEDDLGNSQGQETINK